jgi:sporulation protein YlmC with PRC-barrel domain
MFKTAASIAALTLLSATLAMAQTTSPTEKPAPTVPPAATEVPKTPVPGQIVVQEANTILAKQDLVGQTVYAPDKTKIGSISDLILSKDGKSVEGFLIGVGGFIGIGEKTVALKMDRLKMATDANGAIELAMDMTKDELKNTPTFKSKKEQDAEKQAAERARNQPATTPQPKN